MYSQRFGIVQREVKGPTPKVVMVVSRGCVRVPIALCILAEPNLASSGWLSGKRGSDTVGLSFEKKDNFASVFCPSSPSPASVTILRFYIWRITIWDLEGF